MRFPDEKRLLRGRAAVIDCPRTDCTICISACGFSAARLEDGVPYSDPDKCIGCGGCAGACPEGRIRLYKDRGDGTYEVTLPYEGDPPELDSSLEGGRVIQALPKRPGSGYALVRVIISKDKIRKE